VKKIIAPVFWDRKGILLINLMLPGTTINAAAYPDTLTRLQQAIQNKRRGMLSRSMSLLHDNTWPHSAHVTTALLENSSGIYWTIHHTVQTSRPVISTCFFA